jgi:acyl carrier protein
MYNKLVAYAARQLEIDAADITPASTFESLGIDSLETVEMVMELEEELDTELELDQKVATIGDLVKFIESKLD